MTSHERWNALLAILARDGKIEVEPVAAELGVSAATIRRDLGHLSRQQMLTRTRGGAVVNAISYDLPLQYKAARNAPEKHRIAAAAAAIVPPGSVVGLNGGTTTTEVARILASRADPGPPSGEPGLTVVTNALNIANELVVRGHVKLVVTGGVALPASYELIGPLADGVLQGITLDYAILGVDALDPERGAFAHHEGEAGINRLMAAQARHVIVVTDSTKLGTRAFARICSCDAIGTLVTDRGAAPGIVRAFTQAGVDVVEA